MPIQRINLPSEVLPVALGHYSHAVIAGGLVHFCGIGARSPETGKEVGVVLDDAHQVTGYDISVQTQQVLTNLKAALEYVGCDIADLVDLTVYLRDMRDFLKYNQVYNEFFEGEFVPARTTIEGAPPGQSYILVKAVACKR